MVDLDLAEALRRALLGDANAMAVISSADHRLVRAAAGVLGAPLILGRPAAVIILRGLIDGRIPPPAAQAWASFMRHGFVEGALEGPIRPIDIEFDQGWEDAISATVSRLDEIGDASDGSVALGEALDLLQLLGEP